MTSGPVRDADAHPGRPGPGAGASDVPDPRLRLHGAVAVAVSAVAMFGWYLVLNRRVDEGMRVFLSANAALPLVQWLVGAFRRPWSFVGERLMEPLAVEGNPRWLRHVPLYQAPATVAIGLVRIAAFAAYEQQPATLTDGANAVASVVFAALGLAILGEMAVVAGRVVGAMIVRPLFGLVRLAVNLARRRPTGVDPDSVFFGIALTVFLAAVVGVSVLITLTPSQLGALVASPWGRMLVAAIVMSMLAVLAFGLIGSMSARRGGRPDDRPRNGGRGRR